MKSVKPFLRGFPFTESVSLVSAFDFWSTSIRVKRFLQGFSLHRPASRRLPALVSSRIDTVLVAQQTVLYRIRNVDVVNVLSSGSEGSR